MLAVALVILYFSFLIRSDWVKMKELKDEKAKLTKEIEIAAEKKKEFDKNISGLNSPDHVEIVAREKLGLIKPGETAYKVVK